MGMAKDWEMEQEERGWWSIPGKYVCYECFEDESLKQVVRENLTTSTCDYCGLTAEELTGEKTDLIAAPLDCVIKVIAEGFQSEWNNVDAEGIPYESAEGGYQAETMDTYDLVRDYVSPVDEDLARQIIDALPDHTWVQRHYYSHSEDEALWFGWNHFCELVKHKTRYMFHLRGRRRDQPKAASILGVDTSAKPAEEAESGAATGSVTVSEDSDDTSAGMVTRFGIPMHLEPEEFETSDIEPLQAEREEGIPASGMLDAIGGAVEEVGLIRELPAATKLFRGRLGPPNKPYCSARSLGPPPPRKAIANRMSPAGIPMFYGALDEFTALAETILGKLKRREVVNVGAFVTLEDFFVLDLTRLEPVPSIFSERRDRRPILKFLHSFVRDLSRAIKKDGREHIEYAPTQIVTEYFRHSFELQGGQVIRGILYPSSKALDGVACVLFFTREECGSPQRYRFASRKKQWLRFVRGSAKAFLRKPRRPSKNLFE
ncbi:MAG: HEPN-associated N-terminal domain-containing protein [Candidatus Acidiferrales bacterium]